MRFYKQTDGDYITMIGTGNGGIEISESEYNEILTVIQNRPQENETVGYSLKINLTWEQYEKEPESESQEIDDSEALQILLGGN